MVLTGIGTIDTVAQAIQTQEGWYPGTLSYSNYNPGNLVPAGQPGCTAGAGGFCAFPDYATGYQALLNQVTLDASRGYTILQFTTKYLGGDPANPGVAPGGDPNAYAANIAAASGLNADDPLSAALSGDASAGGDFGSIDMGMLGPTDTMIAVGIAAIALAFMVTR